MATLRQAWKPGRIIRLGRNRYKCVASLQGNALLESLAGPVRTHITLWPFEALSESWEVVGEVENEPPFQEVKERRIAAEKGGDDE